MSDSAVLQGVSSQTITTARLRTHLLVSGPVDGSPVLFVHGNVSSARFWAETLAALPSRYRGLALDLRGFGESETKPVDATRGMRDFADDLHSLIEALQLTDSQRKVQLVGWSAGGGVIMQYAIDHPDRVAALVLIAPLPPYGFGGTKDVDGTPCWPDYAGAGGGTANPEFVQRLASGDTSSESPLSPRMVMNSFYFKPPFQPTPAEEEAFVASLLSTQVGDANYPGDVRTSENWPGVAPGSQGMNNAFAPNYCDLSSFAAITPQPDLLWIRGADDQIVSDTSFFDLGYLGQIGAVPGWPGADRYPPQPMIGQTRAVLDRYRANGGRYHEEVVADCGHSPHIEQPTIFRELVFRFLEQHS